MQQHPERITRILHRIMQQKLLLHKLRQPHLRRKLIRLRHQPNTERFGRLTAVPLHRLNRLLNRLNILSSQHKPVIHLTHLKPDTLLTPLRHMLLNPLCRQRNRPPNGSISIIHRLHHLKRRIEIINHLRTVQPLRHKITRLNTALLQLKHQRSPRIIRHHKRLRHRHLRQQRLTTLHHPRLSLLNPAPRSLDRRIMLTSHRNSISQRELQGGITSPSPKRQQQRPRHPEPDQCIINLHRA